MSVTRPPIHSLQMQQRVSQYTPLWWAMWQEGGIISIGKVAGLRCQDLLSAALRSQDSTMTQDRATVDVEGGGRLTTMTKTVDQITEWDMLELSDLPEWHFRGILHQRKRENRQRFQAWRNLHEEEHQESNE